MMEVGGALSYGSEDSLFLRILGYPKLLSLVGLQIPFVGHMIIWLLKSFKDALMDMLLIFGA